MTPELTHSLRRLGLIVLVVAVCTSPMFVSSAHLHAEGVSWTASGAKVVVVCPLTVGGSFEARTVALTGALSLSDAQPSSVNGELAVDLRTLDTDIGLRNTHMRENYLQVDSQPGYERAVVSAISGGFLASGGSSERGDFRARLTLHGVTREVSGQALLRRHGANVHVEASFPIRLTEFEIPEPRYLGIGVRNEVFVRVTFTALSASAAGSKAS